jgi:hypothetical protein
MVTLSSSRIILSAIILALFPPPGAGVVRRVPGELRAGPPYSKGVEYERRSGGFGGGGTDILNF